MKKMKVARGTARASRRQSGFGRQMAPPSIVAQAAMRADQALANRKLGVLLFHKGGIGVR